MRTIRPMLPKAVASLPVGDDWTYEVKWDGYRALAVKDQRGVRLLSRTQTDLTKQFSSIAADVARLPAERVVLDGELVALDGKGRPSFTALQDWYRCIRDGQRFALAYYVFDLLELNGESWMSRPLAERRRRLGPLVRGDTLLVSGPLPGRPADIEQRIRSFGLEGIVAKRRRSAYHPGERSRDWLKVRFSPRQEFVVGGYRLDGGVLDSLLVGYYAAGEFRYAGQIREGLTTRNRGALGQRLRLRSVACPFVDLPHNLPYRQRHPWDHRVTPADMPSCRWVPPALVIEVAFLGWTRHDLLRQGQFLGMRHDKAAHAVERER